MDDKIQQAMEQIVEETLKDQPQWEADYKKRQEEEKTEGNKEGIEAQSNRATGENAQEQENRKQKKKKIWKKDWNTGETKRKLQEKIRQKRKKFKGKRCSSKKKIYIGAGIAGVVLAVIYFCGVWYYSGRLFQGTKIGTLNCGNMTVEDAEAALKNQVENYTMEILFRDKKEQIQGKDIGYTYESEKIPQTILDEQNAFFWIRGLFGGRKYSAGYTASFDEEKLKEKLLSFDSMKKENMQPAKDAYIAFENNQFVIKEETQGTEIDENLFFEKVKEAVEERKETISAEEEGVYAVPAVLQDNGTLKRQQEIWNRCAAVTVTYLFGDKTEVLDGMRVKDWMTYDEAGNYVENPDGLMANIRAYAAELAAKYDTVGRNRVIKSTATGENVTVEGGNYGFLIDQEAESLQLLSDIQNHSNSQREPVYARKGAVYGENDVGNTYVEVDLTQQHLWYYKDGNLLMDTDFVSGTYYNSERRTPGGSYYLMYKQRDQVLRPAPNPDGSYDYESPVDYWMPFNGGIGFHDADWRWSFGGSIYLYGGSHGCINLPVSFAGGFYESLEAGCPIICFYR